MKKYELVYIIHPDLEGSTAKITEKVKKTITDSKGVIITEENWGKKKLAYEIKKNSFGIYEFLLVEMDPLKIKELERTLRLSEEIIRSMVVLAEEGAMVTKRERKPEKETKKTGKVVEKSEDTKKEDKPVKEVKTEKTPEVKEEKPEKETKKTKAIKEKEEKERLEELDEKLKAIIGPDKE